MSKIFISYSRTDIAFARHLCALLQAEGFDVWMDEEDLGSGDKWWAIIEQNIKSCGAFIVIMSPAAKESEWVVCEILLAKKCKKPILPVLLAGESWSMLANIQYENMTAGLSAVLSPAFVSRLKKYVQPIASAVIEPAFGLPMLEWCDILGGKVIIEHILYEVETFRIAKYPVTNAQFQVFINDAKGYLDQAWWEFSEAARSWKGQHPMPAESTFKGDKLPRENVCWYEAMAFCNWLSAKNGLRITLPTEAQWQRAAHGDHEDPLPWGRVFEETKSNTAHSGINQTTPVDRYPQGASPYLVMDMNGNVWQWCLSEKEHPDKASVYSANGRVMRGGSWCESWVVIENTYRNPIAPDVRASNRGFRIACNPVPLP